MSARRAIRRLGCSGADVGHEARAAQVSHADAGSLEPLGHDRRGAHLAAGEPGGRAGPAGSRRAPPRARRRHGRWPRTGSRGRLGHEHRSLARGWRWPRRRPPVDAPHRAGRRPVSEPVPHDTALRAARADRPRPAVHLRRHARAPTRRCGSPTSSPGRAWRRPARAVAGGAAGAAGAAATACPCRRTCPPPSCSSGGARSPPPRWRMPSGSVRGSSCPTPGGLGFELAPGLHPHRIVVDPDRLSLETAVDVERPVTERSRAGAGTGPDGIPRARGGGRARLRARGGDGVAAALGRRRRHVADGGAARRRSGRGGGRTGADGGCRAASSTCCRGCASARRARAGAATRVAAMSSVTSPVPPSTGPVVVQEEVLTALAEGRGVVALESTILAHGLPHPDNIEIAGQIEDAVRAGGAVPATIAVLGGVVHVGLGPSELERDLHRPRRRQAVDARPRRRRRARTERRDDRGVDVGPRPPRRHPRLRDRRSRRGAPRRVGDLRRLGRPRGASPRRRCSSSAPA